MVHNTLPTPLPMTAYSSSSPRRRSVKSETNPQSAVDASPLPPRLKVLSQKPSSTNGAAPTISLLPRERKPKSLTVDAPERRRRWTPKVKTGCATCRARRIKCDERRPACTHCISSRRQCPGYATDRLQFILHQPVVTSSPPGITPSSQERRIFSLLCSDTVKQVAGAFDRPFWSGSLLRATKVYPAVWHASLALSAIHTRAKILGMTDAAECARREYYGFALQEYNTAIKYLVAIARKARQTIADQETLLLTNLLFIGLSSVQRDFAQAAVHAQSGIQLFHQWQLWERGDDSVASPSLRVLPRASMVYLFTHMETQLINRLDYVSRPPWHVSDITAKCASGPYKSLTEAHFDFQSLCAGLVRAVRYIGASPGTIALFPIPDFLHYYRVEFQVWLSKFQDLLKSGKLQAEDRLGVSYLEIHWLSTEICLNVDLSKGEEAWDDQIPAFRRMMKLSQQKLATADQDIDTDSQDSLGFSYSHSICETFYFVGLYCRDREVRRIVINLLRKLPRRDGIWDSRFIANVVATIADMEDKATELASMPQFDSCACKPGSFICLGHRICSPSIEFLPDGLAKLTFGTAYGLKQGLPMIEVTMEC